MKKTARLTHLFFTLRALNLQTFIMSIPYSTIGILLYILLYYIEPQPIYSIVRWITRLPHDKKVV